MALVGIDGGRKDLDKMSEAEQLFNTVVTKKLNDVGCRVLHKHGSRYSYKAITSDQEVGGELKVVIDDRAKQVVEDIWSKDLPKDINLFVQVYQNGGYWSVYVFRRGGSVNHHYFRPDEPTYGFTAEEWVSDIYDGQRYLDIWSILEGEHGVGSPVLKDFESFVDLVRELLYKGPSVERVVEIKVEMRRLGLSIGLDAARALVRDFVRDYRDYEETFVSGTAEELANFDWLSENFAPEDIHFPESPKKLSGPHLKLVDPSEEIE